MAIRLCWLHHAATQLDTARAQPRQNQFGAWLPNSRSFLSVAATTKVVLYRETQHTDLGTSSVCAKPRCWLPAHQYGSEMSQAAAPAGVGRTQRIEAASARPPRRQRRSHTLGSPPCRPAFYRLQGFETCLTCPDKILQTIFSCLWYEDQARAACTCTAFRAAAAADPTAVAVRAAYRLLMELQKEIEDSHRSVFGVLHPGRLLSWAISCLMCVMGVAKRFRMALWVLCCTWLFWLIVCTIVAGQRVYRHDSPFNAGAVLCFRVPDWIMRVGAMRPT